MRHIRNFSIIAHIDHGKSTLADRFLEITHTIEQRKMREQVLDSMDLERERGITIKMQPVRMHYSYRRAPSATVAEGALLEDYELNLIDTPGHIDFSYEVSRALTAVEGTILLVDATQGVQAQTLTTLRSARELGLVIVPAISKIDSPLANVDDVTAQVAKLLEIDPATILFCSGKTGEGVEALLQAVIERVPPPREEIGKASANLASQLPRALIFDFQYSDHQGVIVFLRLFEGVIKKGDALEFAASDKKFVALEVGTFSPKPTPRAELGSGSIGYVVTGIKEPGFARVGDTIHARGSNSLPLAGYAEPRPVVWASVYPESQDDFTALRQALTRLRLSDSSLSFEEESSGMLGRGFRCGLLGMLHLEIVTERLRREANLSLVVTTPTITYEVELKSGERVSVYSPPQFPEYGDIAKVWEPYVAAEILVPAEYVGPVTPLLYEHEAVIESTENFSEGRLIIKVVMPLRELMRNFFDKMKSVTQGYASISYDLRELREAEVARLDLLVADEPVAAFTRIVAKHRAYEEAVAAVEKLYKILPRQLFTTKIQGQALGRILSSKTLSAMSKDVTQHMYGGDITRKMKLREKQKKGKKRMLNRGRVNIPEEVFLKMVKSDA
ncbi:MAG TPA: translation elongation factor 4 [Candidatus Paceibacterota bacterium]|nr:translation elongation factor 4 [Candidatus Paceibacterota bacterium]